ncbi:MAG TPA: hypothetical protein VD907_01680 [Verrucomicrobiae bacterium]|nr:hypothetical protein [Verrucomicrobiae bacterium]
MQRTRGLATAVFLMACLVLATVAAQLLKLFTSEEPSGPEPVIQTVNGVRASVSDGHMTCPLFDKLELDDATAKLAYRAAKRLAADAPWQPSEALQDVADFTVEVNGRTVVFTCYRDNSTSE